MAAVPGAPQPKTEDTPGTTFPVRITLRTPRCGVLSRSARLQPRRGRTRASGSGGRQSIRTQNFSVPVRCTVSTKRTVPDLQSIAME